MGISVKMSERNLRARSASPSGRDRDTVWEDYAENVHRDRALESMPCGVCGTTVMHKHRIAGSATVNWHYSHVHAVYRDKGSVEIRGDQVSYNNVRPICALCNLREGPKHMTLWIRNTLYKDDSDKAEMVIAKLSLPDAPYPQCFEHEKSMSVSFGGSVSVMCKVCSRHIERKTGYFYCSTDDCIEARCVDCWTKMFGLPVNPADEVKRRLAQEPIQRQPRDMSHRSKVVSEWLNHNIDTTTLLQARLVGDKWNCSPQITVEVLRELEAKLMDMAIVIPSPSNATKSAIIGKLISERDHMLGSLRKAGIDPNSTREVRNFFRAPPLPKDRPSFFLVDTKHSGDWWRVPQDVRDSWNVQKLELIIETAKKKEETHLSLISALQADNGDIRKKLRAMEKENEEIRRELEELRKKTGDTGPNTTNAKREHKSPTETEYFQRTLEYLSKQEGISREEVFADYVHCMISLFDSAFHRRPELITGKRQDLITIREEYLAIIRSNTQSAVSS